MPRAIPANEDVFSMLQTMFGFQEGSDRAVREHVKDNSQRRKSRNEKPPSEPSPYDINYPKSQCLMRSVKAAVFLALLASLVIVIITTFDVVTIKYYISLCMLAFMSFGFGARLTEPAWKPLSQWLGLSSSSGGRRLGRL